MARPPSRGKNLDGWFDDLDSLLRRLRDALTAAHDEAWIDPTEAAGILGVSRVSVCRMAAKHELGAYKNGREWLISRQHATLIAAARKRGPTR